MAFACASDGGYQGGMTLRQWYAGMALQGMLAHDRRYHPRDKGVHWHESISQEAFEIADEMMKIAELEQKKLAKTQF